MPVTDCTAKSTKSVDDTWDKFIEKGRKGMRAATYRQWCEANNRSVADPVEFESKNGETLKVVEEFPVTGFVAWCDVGFATEANKNSTARYGKVRVPSLLMTGANWWELVLTCGNVLLAEAL
jgi:hypothetical protein